MKKNDRIILLAAASFSALFYKQYIALNLLVFVVILLLLLLYLNKQLFKNIAILSCSLFALSSAIACAIHGSTFSALMCCISLLVLAGTAANPSNSILANGFHTLYSYASVGIFMLIDLFHKPNNDDEKQTQYVWKKLILLISACIISLLFFILYRDSNIMFKWFSDQICWNWISIGFIGFVLLGFVLSYVFFKQRTITKLQQYDLEKGDIIIDGNEDFFNRFISIPSELFIASALFIMLNVLTGFVNISDILYTWSSKALPEGVTYSEYIHNGISSLIVSIIIAILIIVYIFRGAINFSKNNKSIKVLATIWLLQNIFLLISTLLRNKMYVEQYSLTEKRIGVFIYLALCIPGLLLCIYKISTNKNTIFLFRKTTWAILGMLSIFSLPDWNTCISRFNINRSEKKSHFYIDPNYLDKMNYNNLAVLWNYYQKLPDQDFRKALLKTSIDKKMMQVLDKEYSKDFRSHTYKQHVLYGFIKQVNEKQELHALDASRKGLQNLDFIKDVNNVDTLDISNNIFRSYEALQQMKRLRYLDISLNRLDSVKRIPTLASLHTLLAKRCQLYDLKQLENKQIECLDISENPIKNLDALKAYTQLKVLNISGITCKNLDVLKQLQLLHELHVSGTNTELLPYLEQVQSIYVSAIRTTTNSYSNSYQFLEKLPFLKNAHINQCSLKKLEEIQIASTIKQLDISNNQLEYIDYEKPNFILQKLIASKNQIHYINNAIVNELTYLDVASNKISELGFIQDHPSLQYVNLSENPLILLDTLRLPVLNELLLNEPTNRLDVSYLQTPKLKRLEMMGSYENASEYISRLRELQRIKISYIDNATCDALCKLPKLKKIECYYIEDSIYRKLIDAHPGIWIVRNDAIRKSYSLRSDSSLD